MYSPGKFGQDIFTLRSSFFEGRPPKSVNMHWRRFRVADIPIDDDKAFEVWLRNRWREKDYLLEYFTRTGRFPTDQNWMLKETHQKANGDAQRTKSKTIASKYIETQVKSNSWEEFLLIFAPISAFVIVLFLFYSASNGGIPGGNGEGAPQEWKDVMNHAAAMVQSASKLSEVQQAVNMTTEAAESEYAEDEKTQMATRPLLRRAKSSSSTAVSSQNGAAKYRFVPANGAANPTKAASAKSEPKKVIRLTDGRTVPLSKAFGPTGLDDVKPASAIHQQKEVKTASGMKLKVNPSGAKKEAPTVAKPTTITTSSGRKLKLAAPLKAPQSKPKASSSVNGITKKAPPRSTAGSVTSNVAVKPNITPSVKNSLRKTASTPNIKTVQGLKIKSTPQKAVAMPQGKKQLSNGMWVNVESPKSAKSTAMNGVKSASSQPKRLANGVLVS